ncbi:MAG: hypothetical protein NTV49_10895 [Kiritimatiellaeota bacterium]|nr:hypothetical protein [Kiritimatiellota bacterium]
MPANHLQRRAGFSMVEVALAILVLSVGLLAVFGLFADGLGANQKTIEDTQSALFADEVLNGFRAAALTNAWAAQPNITIPEIWKTPRDISYGVLNVRDYKYSNNVTADYTYRYGLSTNAMGNVQGVTLTVYPGIGGTTTNVFYTEVYNFGM